VVLWLLASRTTFLGDPLKSEELPRMTSFVSEWPLVFSIDVNFRVLIDIFVRPGDLAGELWGFQIVSLLVLLIGDFPITGRLVVLRIFSLRIFSMVTSLSFSERGWRSLGLLRYEGEGVRGRNGILLLLLLVGVLL